MFKIRFFPTRQVFENLSGRKKCILRIKINNRLNLRLIMKITIIGLGLIGGSLALSLRENGFADHLIGVDKKKKHQLKALELGLVDECLELDEAIEKSDIIVIAAPVDATLMLLPKILDKIDNQIVIEVASTKKTITASVANHPKRGQYVATHPMAGTEYSGPEAAVRHLFTGKTCVLCDSELSDPTALKTIEKLYKSMFMRLIYLNSDEHDVHTAYISHISHISSFALALTVLEKEKDETQIFQLASGGFDSTVRLAKSNPETWIPIFKENQDNLLDVLDEYITTLLKFKGLMLSEGYDKLQSELVRANDIKRILK
jgi:prephenate dehydrogenase